MRKVRVPSLLFILAIFLGILSFWINTIVSGNMPFVDQWTREFVSFIAHSRLYNFALLVTELGSSYFLIPFTMIMGILLLLLYRDWLPALVFSGGTLISHLLNQFLKVVVARERPSINIEANAEGYSFPSGHAMISLVCYGLLLYFLEQKLVTKKVIFSVRIFFYTLIIFIGLSRYIINVHYLTDVITGFIAGYMLLICFIYAFNWIQQWRSSE